jgi:hypothetical protein
MGCLKLTYGHEETPTLFLGSDREKIHSPDLQVWVNPDSDFLGVGIKTQTQGGPWLGEQSPNSAYTIRGNDVGVGNLFFEYLTGTGPEYSMFTDGHPMVNALKDSYIVSLAKIKFTLGGSNPLIQWDAPFGLVGAGLSNSLTEQFVGGARVSIIPTAAGMLFMVDNTTGRYSFHGHSQSDIPRNPSMLTPEGNIYQRFIWLQK